MSEPVPLKAAKERPIRRLPSSSITPTRPSRS